MTGKLVEDKEYIKANKLDRLINFDEGKDYKEGTYGGVDGKLSKPFPPITEDLARLHKTIRERRVLTVLEFGTGYSTIIMADALKRNQIYWNLAIRNRHPFKVFSVDASREWIERTKQRFPKSLLEYVQFHYSPVKIGTFNGQLCHYYINLPNIIPDFIYLDGPAATDVKGTLYGLNFWNCDDRTVMAGDLLLMESTLLPGTFIIIDGRTNNARFLLNNFKRKWRWDWDRKGDVTTFELVEERLGKHNQLFPYRVVKK